MRRDEARNQRKQLQADKRAEAGAPEREAVPGRTAGRQTQAESQAECNRRALPDSGENQDGSGL